MLVTCVTAMKVTYLTDSHSKSNYLTKLDLKQNGAILTFPGLVRRNVWKLCGPGDFNDSGDSVGYCKCSDSLVF